MRRFMVMLIMLFNLADADCCNALGQKSDPGVYGVEGCVHYSTQALIITKEDDVAVVMFTEIINLFQVKYVYKVLRKDGTLKEGKGELILKRINMTKDKKFDIDRGLATIKADRISLLWDSYDKEMGYYYYLPESGVSVQITTPYRVEGLDLRRFQTKTKAKTKD